MNTGALGSNVELTLLVSLTSSDEESDKDDRAVFMTEGSLFEKPDNGATITESNASNIPFVAKTSKNLYI